MLALMGWALVARDRSRPSERNFAVASGAVSGSGAVAEVAGEPGLVEERIARCAQPLPLPCEIRSLACQAELFELAACVYGQNGRRPELRFVSERTLVDERVGQRERIEPLAFALERLGLAAPREEQRTSADGPTFTAFYTPRHAEVWAFTSEAVASDSEVAGFVLVHEYIHALQDGDAGLAHTLETRPQRTFDADLALWSAIEGEATFYEEAVRAVYYGQRIGAWVPSRLALRTNSSDDAIVRQRFPLTASFVIFPYTYGADWATRELLGAGASPWARARQAVLSTREVMAGRHGWWNEPAPPCIEREGASLAHGQSPTGIDALGAWVMQAYVRKHTADAELARRAARDLRGDVLTMYSDDASQRRGFVWLTCWSSVATADTLREVIRAALATTLPGSFELTQRAHDVVVSVFEDSATGAVTCSSS